MSKDNRNRRIKTSRAPRRSNRRPPAVGAAPTRKTGCSLTLIYIAIVAALVMVICC